MSIQFNCDCGRTLQVADEHAGKKARCKGCGATPTVPTPEPEEDDDVEMDVEVVEDEPAKEEKITKEKRPKLPREEEEEDERAPRKRKKRRREDREGPMSRMYANQAKKQLERDEWRTRSYGRDDDDKGWTIGNVHITAGVIGGATLLFLGIVCMILIAIFKDDQDVIIGPRIFIGAIVCTVIGIGTLVKSLFFGEED